MNIKEINSKKLFKEFEIQIPYKDIDDSKIVEEKPKNQDRISDVSRDRKFY